MIDKIFGFNPTLSEIKGMHLVGGPYVTARF